MATFKTRARAVDMLGRQQIAGIPTAISELFKNAHDAYADRVEVDYYRSDKLLVLRDDGLGMTEEDFQKRWLTLGTESKIESKAGIKPPPIDPHKKKRPILGEKGIGRLAIAAIGPQVLVLTKAKLNNKTQNTIAAFINWRLFECPGIDLEQIDIPVRIFPNGTFPSQTDVAEMIQAFRINIHNLKTFLAAEQYDYINKDLDKFSLNPEEIYGYLSPGPGLSGAGHGTHFFILPTNEILERDIDGDGDADKASPLTKALHGFTNTMTPNHAPPRIKTAFRDYKTDDASTDLIGEREFFTPDEFLNADHHIIGKFDEYGQFKGTVSVYGEEYNDHIISWANAGGSPTLCGSFTINVANVQGAARESTIPLEDYGRLVNKMSKFGGLYIYKDGIRILPYGDTDYDWLDIEKNRTKSASYYFFSYRRIFGVIEVDQFGNAALNEKAGREGFRENMAYRQFKSILKNFFIQLAADFFRDRDKGGGIYAERYKERKIEIERQELARRKRQEQVSQKKSELTEELEKFFTSYDAGKPQAETLALAEAVTSEIERISDLLDPKQAAQALLESESRARGRLGDLQENYRIVKPRGVGLSKKLQKEWDDYRVAYDRLQETVFSEARTLIEDLIGEKAEKARLELDRRLRIESALNELAEQARKTAKTESIETRDVLTKVHKDVIDATRESIAEVETVMSSVFSDFARLDVLSMKDEQVVEARNKLEAEIVGVKEKEQQFLQYVRTQLESINLSDDISQLDQIEALEQRNMALEEQAETDLQLTQLGMAIEVINHEFEGSVKSIRNNLQRFKAWADINKDLQELYLNIRSSFDHLDGYLTLFTPLHRRLYRTETEFSGADIHKFLEDLFKERLRRHNINIEPTKSFLRKKITGYPSSYYPIFVNIVDNALFWLKDHSLPRTVMLDARDNTLLICNNGPAIPERDREVIFDLGFSRKPGGRGMGLHISREVLKRIGYQLTVGEGTPHYNVIFCIKPNIKEEESYNANR